MKLPGVRDLSMLSMQSLKSILELDSAIVHRTSGMPLFVSIPERQMLSPTNSSKMSKSFYLDMTVATSVWSHPS